MKISLITTLPSLIENQRLKQEAQTLGHKFQLIDLRDLNFEIKKNQLRLPGITNTQSNLVIFRGIFTSIRSYQPLIKHLREKGIKVFDNNLGQHQYSINKVTDLLKLSLNNIPVPNSIYTNLENYPQSAPQLGFPLIIKSTRAGKGIGVNKIDSQKDLQAFISQTQAQDQTSRGQIIQEFIPYIHDLRLLCIGQQIFTMKRIPAPGEFRANFSLGGKVEPFQPSKKNVQLARQALKAINISVAGVDILITKDNQQYVLEVNHTPGFVGMEKATQKNIAKTYLQHTIKNAQ